MMDLAVIESEASGPIPSGWSERKLQDVAQLINGRGFKPFEWKTAGLPIIRIQNLNGSDDFNYYSGRYDSKIEVDPGQLLFAWSGSRGTSFGPHIWNGPKGVLNYHTWKVRVNESEIIPGFFFHVLKHLTRIIEDQAHGASALVHVQKWEMEKFPFQCPDDSKEQEAIAEALSDADALIEGLERLIAKKRLIKQGAMQDLLTAKRRLPGFSGEWVESKLGEIVRITTGRKDVNEGNPCGQFPFFTCARRYTYSDTYSFDCEAIMVAGNGEVGNLSRYSGKFEAYQRTYVLMSFQAPIEFIWHQLQAHLATSLGIGKIGSSIPYIKKNDLTDFCFKTPSEPEEAEAISKILDDMDAEIQAFETRLEKARQVKEGMMQNLLTGRIRLV